MSWHYTFHYIIYYIYSEEAESEIAKQDVDRVDHIADDLGKEKESVSFYILILSTICLSFICTIILCSIHVKRVIGEFEPLSWGGVLNTTLCDKVCQWLATGRWFSPGTLVPSSNKTDYHDIAEILLKVVLSTITPLNVCKSFMKSFHSDFHYTTNCVV